MPNPSAKKGVGKGALIKGMAKRLPHEILGNPLFQVGQWRIMRGYPGIYALSLQALHWMVPDSGGLLYRTGVAGR